MLRIGLTGGIGAGKSAVATTFADCGGVVVDADVIAREVVEPGTDGLAALVEAFGNDILSADGALDRPALAAKAFKDDDARNALNGIVHPLVGKRREEIIAALPADAVVVEDIPLLVESGMAPLFPLVVIVHADVDVPLNGRGIALVPSVFVGQIPSLHQNPSDPSSVPWLVLPPAGSRMEQRHLWGDPRPRGAALAALVGRNRAAVLSAVAHGCTTTELADRVGISLASASQHASVLRDAGLITTRRQGSAVLHVLTPLGAELLQAG